MTTTTALVRAVFQTITLRQHILSIHNMANIAAITGVQRVIDNLRRRRDFLAAGVERGLTRAGLMLQRESQRLVPVDYGVLKASAFTRKTGSGFGTVVTVGYTAAYAIYVHENVEMRLRGEPRPAPHKGRYWDPQGRGQSKFLEEPARRLRGTLRQIILDEARIVR